MDRLFTKDELKEKHHHNLMYYESNKEIDSGALERSYDDV